MSTSTNERDGEGSDHGHCQGSFEGLVCVKLKKITENLDTSSVPIGSPRSDYGGWLKNINGSSAFPFTYTGFNPYMRM